MRAIIVLLFLVCFAVTSFATREISGIAKSRESFKSPKNTFLKAPTFTDKQVHAISLEEAIATNVVRIHQNLQGYNFFFTLGSTTNFIGFSIRAYNAEAINNNNRNFYSCLFKCLYPKHTFW